MKILLSLFMAVGLTYGVAAAQDLSGNANNGIAETKPGVDVSGFKAPATLNQSSKEIQRFPNTHPNLKPQLGGIFVDGGKYGTQLINPAAPEGYGYGEKYLSAPSSRSDLMHESGPAAHRDAGGFKLFSIEF
jgi:hypothetical protein